MPTYEYRCTRCRKQMEINLPITAVSAALPLCFNEGCDGSVEMERIISRTSFSLSGGGWARDGYTKKGS